jgi:hypothetical protein
MAKQQFQLGDRVYWTSQAAGYSRMKAGLVTQVIPRGKQPKMRGIGMARDHESYVIRASVCDGQRKRTKLYWPRVSQLKHFDD